MLDMLHKLDDERKITYVWFNTGLEYDAYDATKRHLDELELKYNIKIERVNAVKPIPVVVREYGLPFLSKIISQHMGMLRQRKFHFRENGNYEQDMQDYHCKGALNWW